MIACSCPVCQSDDPRDNRLRSSLLIEKDGKRIVIDIGPDFREQMLRNSVDDIDSVLITHGHRDHIAGLDEVRAYNFIHRKSIPMFADEPTEKKLRSMFDYVFDDDPYPGKPRIELQRIGLLPFETAGMRIIPIWVMHYKMPVTCFRIGDLTYITDAKTIAPEEVDKVRGSRVLIVNALRREDHISHFTLDEALEFAAEIGAERTYFTHISHQLGRYEEVNPSLPEGVELAFDGLEIAL